MRGLPHRWRVYREGQMTEDQQQYSLHICIIFSNQLLVIFFKIFIFSTTLGLLSEERGFV